MYDIIARYYDLIHGELTADIPLAMELAQETTGPVLELGCGTGRLLVPLARAGYEVVGLDNSPAMLELARAKLAKEPAEVSQRVTLITSEMTGFELAQRFGLVLLLNSTLMNLPPTAMQATLNRVTRHLLPGGRLLIDLDNPAMLSGEVGEGVLVLERTMVDPASGETIMQFAASQTEEAGQVVHVTWLFDSLPAGSSALSRVVVPMDYHYLYPHQLALMLANAGLQLESLMGDYDRRPFEEESPRLLALASSGQ
jgi:SAM-dependent methyltransferase